MESKSGVLGLFQLDGRVALVTGAGGYLGRSISYALCEAGAHVVLGGRSRGPLEGLATELTGRGLQASVAEFDVTRSDQVSAVIERLWDDFGRLDIVVNNAYNGRPGTMEAATIEDFDRAYRVCVTAAFDILQTAMPLLKQSALDNSGGASVINVASMYGIVSPDPAIYGSSGKNNPPYYGAAKAGLIQLSQYAACHLAPERIRVNTVSPGPFPPASIMDTDPDFHRALCAKNPLKRIGHPDDLKGAILYLASDASAYVTGINLKVDGGWTAW